MKGLPIGKQHFGQIISENLLYVDKTEIIYSIVEKSGYYFLSRPRRFGKSLLIDTLKEIFLGNQQLFKGLWIHDKIEWKTHPIIHIDFSKLDYYTKSLSEAIENELDSISNHYNIVLEKKGVKDKFSELITKLAKKEKVVVLIDEYDRPITDSIAEVSIANKQRNILRQFYGVLKPLGNHIKLVFITGITTYSKVSLFSVVNNLTDLTFHEKYAALVGITQEELLTNFKPYIEQAAIKNKKSQKKLLKLIKQKYNGYSWDGETLVYNPFSLLNFFSQGRFKDYWFVTGTPTFLIKILKHHKISGEKMEKYQVRQFFFDNFEVTQNLDIFPLLFQTGYSTIKSIKWRNSGPIYTLGYPNEEVRHAFIYHLIEAYTNKKASTVHEATIQIETALQERDIKLFKEQLNILLSDISYRLFPFEKKDKDAAREQQEFMAWEGYFHTIIYLILQYISVEMQVEISKHKGQIDAIVEADDYLYIMEYKLEDAKLALNQIIKNKYAHSYANSKKQVVLMGIAFDREKKEVKDIEWQIWNKELFK